MTKFFWLIIGIPVAVLLIVFSVANRQITQLRLDPFNTEHPAFALELPFFVFLFAALLIGLGIGGLSVWISQGHYRRDVRRQKNRADSLEKQADRQKTDKPALPDGRNRAA